MKIVDLEQGSPQWLEWRKSHPTASYAGCILGTPKYSPRNWDQLAELYRGERRIYVTKAMQHGAQMEPIARECAESELGLLFEPAVVVDDDDFIAASLDGITIDGDVILELKCPYKGFESALWSDITNDDVHPHYVAQVQQQLMVSGAQRCVFAVWVDGTIEWRDIYPDPDMHRQLRDGWSRFAEAYELFGRASGVEMTGT